MDQIFTVNKKNDNELCMEDQLSSSMEPIGLFEKWFKMACKETNNPYTNAMCLATCKKNGSPCARIVTLKDYDENGFLFCTHYNSNKAKQLEENPNVAATFYWNSLNKMIRIEGEVVKVVLENAEKYFHTLSFSSQITQFTGKQSTVLRDRHGFVKEIEELMDRYTNQIVPCPSNWGGYKIIPHYIEFVQLNDKVHDRICFRKPEKGEIIDWTKTHMGHKGWVYEYLAP